MPAIGVTCTNPQVTADCDEYFRICFLDPFQGTVLANYAWESGCKKAYCLSKLGDDYSVGLVNYFTEAFKKLGGEVVEEQFPDKNSDFTSYVANAKKGGCDVFFAPVSTEAAALIIDQAEAQSLGMPILAGDTWDSNVITEAAKGKNVDITVTTFYQEGGNPEFDEGIKAWMEGNSTALTNNGGNTDLAAVTAMGYDAYFVALEAMKAAGSTDPADILAALPALQVSGLVCGDVSFNETGDANKTEAFVKKCNTETGAWEFVKTQSAE
jgi:branched-chain amino acid transport system substrate-binding protein